MIRNIGIALTLCVLLSACEMIVPPWHYWSLHTQAQQPVTCSGEADCTAKWNRAEQWVKTNAQTSIASETPMLIKTADSPPLSPIAAFTVTMTPDGRNAVIKLKADCADFFGCIPPLLELRADFAQYVMNQNAPLKKVQ